MTKPTYDEFMDDGSYQPEKLDPITALKALEANRAGGGVVCDLCHKTYSEHRNVPYTGGLTRLCDGRLVKL